jgi:hypothetical protein
LLKKACPKKTVFLQGGRFYTAHITSPRIAEASVQIPKALGIQDAKNSRVELELLCSLSFTWSQRHGETCVDYKSPHFRNVGARK